MLRTLMLLIVCAVALMSLFSIGGCAEKSIHYKDPEGREISYINRGFDTKFSGARFLRTPDGGVEMQLENYSSEAKVAQEALKSLDAVIERMMPLVPPAIP